MNAHAKLPGKIGPDDVRKGMRILALHLFDLSPLDQPLGNNYPEWRILEDPYEDDRKGRHVLVAGSPSGASGAIAMSFRRLFADYSILIECTEQSIRALFKLLCDEDKLEQAEMLRSTYLDQCPAEMLAMAWKQRELQQTINQIRALVATRDNVSRQINELTISRNTLLAKLGYPAFDS